MYNDFVIVGPSSDPAGIKGMKQATEALKKISEKECDLYQPGRQIRNPCGGDAVVGESRD